MPIKTPERATPPLSFQASKRPRLMFRLTPRPDWQCRDPCGRTGRCEHGKQSGQRREHEGSCGLTDVDAA